MGKSKVVVVKLVKDGQCFACSADGSWRMEGSNKDNMRFLENADGKRRPKPECGDSCEDYLQSRKTSFITSINDGGALDSPNGTTSSCPRQFELKS